MMAIVLPELDDLAIIYGNANIRQWADMDNDDDTTKILQRVAYAVTEAKRYVYQRLALRYDVSLWETLPEEVFSIIAKRAGIELYATPRGLKDGTEAAKMLATISIAIEAKLEQILTGQVTLLDLPDEQQPMTWPVANNSTASFIDEERYRRQQRTGEPYLSDDMNFYRN